MLTKPSTKIWLIALLAATLLTLRVGGAHLHLCMDGSEPPAALHFEGPDHNDDHHPGSVHDDVDVPLVADAITKISKLGLDLPALLAVLLAVAFLWRGQARRLALRPARILASEIDYLRPPLRGPPLLTSP